MKISSNCSLTDTRGAYWLRTREKGKDDLPSKWNVTIRNLSDAYVRITTERRIVLFRVHYPLRLHILRAVAPRVTRRRIDGDTSLQNLFLPSFLFTLQFLSRCYNSVHRRNGKDNIGFSLSFFFFLHRHVRFLFESKEKSALTPSRASHATLTTVAYFSLATFCCCFFFFTNMHAL